MMYETKISRRTGTKISNEGGGEAGGGHGEGHELPEKEHEQQAPCVFRLDLHGSEHG